jgi:hypothetical protein
MGVRKRVEDAELLWHEGQAEGSLLMALIAAFATARRKYPKLNDGEGFERLLLDARKWRLALSSVARKCRLSVCFGSGCAAN